MKFAIVENHPSTQLKEFADELDAVLSRRGHERSDPENGIQFVLNLTDTGSPVPIRRRSQSVFVFSFVVADRFSPDLKSICYTALVQSLSNQLLCLVQNGGAPHLYCTTPEAGFYEIPPTAEEICSRLLTMASARFATNNLLSTDLPSRFWTTSTIVDQIKQYGRELDELGVLPTPFPLREVLSEDAIHHLFKIYGITGASYGNLSARELVPELGPATFWMTGRGVDKSDLQRVGKDVLLVKGFDMTTGTAYVSVPPEHDPRARVSVDAIEHFMIYDAFPDVGAIVHAHAWIEGIPCTRQNYPCGTRELALEVLQLLRSTDCPARSAVGLKNHGLTITGPSLEDIFCRLRGNVRTQVPMFA